MSATIKIGNHEVVHITEVRELRRELAESNEYARKLSIKVTDQGVEIQRLKGELEITAKISDVCKRQEVELQHSRDEMVKLQRIKDAGDLVFQELDDLTPEENCECSPHGWDCASCLFKGARAAIIAWKEANK
jgi:hypothetical protein